MVQIWTAQYAYKGPDRVDISTRKTHPQGAAFAPLWKTMVGPYRDGLITEADYTEMYIECMRESYIHRRADWNWLLNQSVVTLVCFCRPGAFCHRVILAKRILDIHFKEAQYMGERILS